MFKKKQNKNEKAALPRAVRKKVILYAAVCICLLILSIVLFIVQQNLSEKVKLREMTNEEYSTAQSDVENLQNTIEEKQRIVQKNGKDISNPILDEQTLYAYITSATEKFGLTIGFLRSGDSTNQNGIATQHYEMMFTGSNLNLKLMLESLDTLPSAYAIEALSFRVKSDKEWISRAIDENTTYDWYEVAEDSITNSTSEEGPYTLADMLDYEQYTMYLDLAFVSTE